MSSKPLFIADGHHRYETSLKYRNKVRENGQNEDADLPVDYVMMMCVSMKCPGLKILPTHRVVKSVDGFNSGKIKEKLQELFNVEPVEIDHCKRTISGKLWQNADKHSFIIYIGEEKKYYLLTMTKNDAENTAIDLEYSKWKCFDVGILHGMVFNKLFGLKEIPSKNEKTVEYVKEPSDAVSMVDDEGYQFAVFLNPTRIEDVQLVANDRQIMPPKSTYFYPKLITGMVVSKL